MLPPRASQRGVPLKTRPVQDIMSRGPIACVNEVGNLSDVMDALRHTQFHGFPVVRSVNGEAVVVGLISREHLKARRVAVW
jgi:CBS domain-containing protein